VGPGVEEGDERGAFGFDTGPVIPFEGSAEDVITLLRGDEMEDVYGTEEIIEL